LLHISNQLNPFSMNNWRLSAILKGDVHVSEVRGITTANFSVSHTELLTDSSGSGKNEVTWVSCTWPNPDIPALKKLKNGVLMYLEGVPFVQRDVRKGDGSIIWVLSMRVRAAYPQRDTTAQPKKQGSKSPLNNPQGHGRFRPQ
jgi:hypothetical protein